MEIEQAIVHLEAGIRRLKVRYDAFFAGAAPRPPTDLRAELDRLIRRFANAPIKKYSDRFHFNTLVGRYNCFIELWNKQTRSLEEGRERATGLSVAGRAAEQPPEAGAHGNGERVLYRLCLSEVAADSDGVRELFEHYLEARRRRDGSAPRLSLSSFASQLSRQAASLKASSGCGAVEFRVTSGENINIKARPSAEEPAGPEHPKARKPS